MSENEQARIYAAYAALEARVAAFQGRYHRQVARIRAECKEGTAAAPPTDDDFRCAARTRQPK